ncbi:MAG: glycosyltransferase family 39 protein [Shimia sp.]
MRPDHAARGRPLAWAVGFVAALTAYRLALHVWNGTDLFVDEAQYWAWGQYLDWGYFSKPPMIGWLLRGITDLAGSDAAFWVRAPAPVLHGVTALIVMAIGARAYDPWVGAWAGAIYVAMPLVTVGSALMSTDTVMLPFYALALWMLLRLTERPSLRDAVLLGIGIGAGLMSKYAMVYFLMGWALVALVQPTARIAWRDAGVALAVGAALFAPNVWWNVVNDGTTVRHVVEDNAKWSGLDLRLGQAAEFLANQWGAFGLVFLPVLLWLGWRGARGRLRGVDMTLVLFALPVIALVTVQALQSRAFGNWAAVAYVAAPVVVVAALQMRRGWLVAGQGVNLALALALPVLLTMPEALRDGGGAPLLSRYLNLHDQSLRAAAVARAEGLDTIVARSRRLSADLLYTLRDDPLRVRALPPVGAPRSWYEQTLPLPPVAGDVAFLTALGDAPCAEADLLDRWRRPHGAMLSLWRLPESCRP